MTKASVRLWGRDVGALVWLPDRAVGVFQYLDGFEAAGVEPAPLTMRVGPHPFEFPTLPRSTFKGLPGLLADSLPDRFGNAVIDQWLAARRMAMNDFDPVQRLCAIGRRGMGALEFEPRAEEAAGFDDSVDVERLVELANRIVATRAGAVGDLTGDDDSKDIDTLLRVGASAGGARAKAVLAWNPGTGEFRSGQLDAPDGFEHWLIKFDGVSGNGDRGAADPQGYGLIEFAYSKLASIAGVEMSECRLHEEGGRSHFMTRRFDRIGRLQKLHMQSLGAIAHLDFNAPDENSYEQALDAMDRLGSPRAQKVQLVRRAFFNVVARNQDDHVKNISFLMEKSGVWRLSPAYDVVYAFKPGEGWTQRHQMSINGKRSDFAKNDLFALAARAGVKKRQAATMLDEVVEAVRRWPSIAAEVGVSTERVAEIAAAHRIVW